MKILLHPDTENSRKLCYIINKYFKTNCAKILFTCNKIKLKYYDNYYNNFISEETEYIKFIEPKLLYNKDNLIITDKNIPNNISNNIIRFNINLIEDKTDDEIIYICNKYLKINDYIEKYNDLGIVITTHGYNGVYIKQAIECYLKFLPNAYIIIYINESEDEITLNLKNEYPNIKFIYIENQKKSGGLTNTWNKGIDLCIKNNCKIIILSNDDILFGNSIYHIIDEAYNCSDNKYFGPLTNNPGPAEQNKKNQYSLTSKNTNNYPCKDKNNYYNINGFFMVFPLNVLKNNMYNKKYYFNPKFPFGGNETEWFDRFKGIPVIVPKTFIYHYKLAKWKNKIPNNYCIYTINFNNYEGNSVLLKNNTDLDCLYFLNNLNFEKYSPIYKCIQKGVIPFYINLKNKNGKLIQRTIKTNPTKYLPHNYTKTIYIDGNLELTKKIYNSDINNYLKKYDLICFHHLESNTFLEEAKTVIKLKLEKVENVNKILDLAKKDNLLNIKGLTETNILIRNHKNIIFFSNEWEKLINICIRDQISFDYLLNKHKVNYNRLKYNQKPVIIHNHIIPSNRKII